MTPQQPFILKHYRLPHDGIIRGARGHKQEIIPAGTKVWCITYGTKIFSAAYLDEEQALGCMNNLAFYTKPYARRHIPLNTLVEWNFRDRIPTKVVRRPK